MDQYTKYIEKLQFPAGHLQRRDVIVTIAAATATVAVAGTLYSLIHRALDNPGCKTVPYSLPFVGSSIDYRKDPQTFMEKWTKELGPVFRAHVFGEVMTVVSGPYVREIFLNNDFNFVHGINKRFDLNLLLGIDDKDADNTELRQIVLKHLHNNMRPYTPRVVRQLKKAGDEIVGQVSEEEKVFPHVYPIMQHMIANAAASIFVGENLVKNEKLIESFKNMTIECGAELRGESLFFEYFSTLNRWRQWYIGKFSKTVQRHRSQLYNALKPEVEERLANCNKPGWERPRDILQDLIEDSKCPPGKDLILHLTEWIILLIFASIHTTSENSTVIMYRLLQHPELIPELLEEQNRVLSEHLGEDVVKSTDDAVSLFTFDVIRNLPKLDSLCRESLRLRNDFLTLPHKYMGKSNFTLSNGVVIKPGEYALINAYYNHRAEDIQHDNTGNHDVFQPFRYADVTDRQSTKIGDDYLIFGLGKHACPGRWFALQEVKTIVSFFIRQYEISNRGSIVFPTNDGSKMPFGQFVVKKRSI